MIKIVLISLAFLMYQGRLDKEVMLNRFLESIEWVLLGENHAVRVLGGEDMGFSTVRTQDAECVISESVVTQEDRILREFRALPAMVQSSAKPALDLALEYARSWRDPSTWADRYVPVRMDFDALCFEAFVKVGDL